MDIHHVLIKPTITEKSTLLQESGKYTFHIAPRANKVEVKEAVEKNFGVTVLDVNITKLRGKQKRYGPRIKKRPDTKQAVATLNQGHRTNLHEGPQRPRHATKDSKGKDAGNPERGACFFRRDHRYKAGEIPARSKAEPCRTQQPGPHHITVAWWRVAAHVP